jgi:8-oxo-dGTP pyrophosphatase MutT (NUDIX family)
VTGQRHWDLPKGGIHEGETPAEAALRETMEETGLVFAAQALVDLGRFAYTGKKDLHLFAAPSERVDPLALCCESTFVERGSSRRCRRWTASAGSPSIACPSCARRAWRRC